MVKNGWIRISPLRINGPLDKGKMRCHPLEATTEDLRKPEPWKVKSRGFSWEYFNSTFPNVDHIDLPRLGSKVNPSPGRASGGAWLKFAQGQALITCSITDAVSILSGLVKT